MSGYSAKAGSSASSLIRLAGLGTDEKARLVATAIQTHDSERRESFAARSTNKLRI